VSGNYCIDKKPALINFLQGRGKSGWAEAVIPASVTADVLKTTPEALHEVWMAKCIMGSIASGSLGYNAHYANVVAAFFAATGQDLAHVVEGSMGVTAVRILENRDMHISVYLPAIMIGTVGGGTKLKVKQEAISITGVSSSVDLAKVLAGAVLAGELSLLASLAEGSLAIAHSKLGR
jgi:hydroxymethylglutaryl-CoA reductase (NADPH)